MKGTDEQEDGEVCRARSQRTLILLSRTWMDVSTSLEVFQTFLCRSCEANVITTTVRK